MMWISFELAAEEVERRLGVSWGKAQKVLLEACENKEVKSQRTECGPDVLDTEFWEWLKAKQYPPRGGKQSRILKHLAAMFPNKRVPDPSDYSRKALRADLLERDPGLALLDESTLKSAIDRHNARCVIRNDPIRLHSD
jgi:hypothetical protein